MKWIVLAVLAFFVINYLSRLLRGATTLGPPRRDKPPRDPHAVLGVAPGASADEISQAYREQMKRYHPDRVADLGEELRQLAHEKTVAIQRAYEELRTQSG